MLKKIIFIVLAIIVILILVLVFFNKQEPTLINATIKNQPLKLELALNNKQWFDGLSNRASLCDNCGMLFIFPDLSAKTFVMRQMNFPLDIIWLNNKTVIAYAENLQPEASPPYTPYQSPEPVNAVLEVPAGFVKTNNIKIKDILTYEQINQ